jgi:hypothetical protein
MEVACSSKRWHLNTNLHGIISQNTVVITCTVVIISKLKRVSCTVLYNDTKHVVFQFPDNCSKNNFTGTEIKFLLAASKRHKKFCISTKSNYSLHRIPPLVLIVSPITPVHAPSPISSIFIFCIILPSPPTSSEWPFAFRFTYQNHVCTSLLPNMPRLTHLFSLDHPNCIWRRLQIMELLIKRVRHFTE